MANRDYVPDCDLSLAGANGECGALANSNFGTVNPGASFDPEIIAGWGKRFYNWEFSGGIQHQLLAGVSLDVSYYRRWFGNFTVTDNTLVAPSDYTPFSITAPLDPRLPGGGGYTIGGLFDLNPNKVGQVSDLITFGDNYGKMLRHWDGVDVSLAMRPRNGLMVQGGISTGRELRDYCDVIAPLPEILFAGRQIGPRVGALPTLGYAAGASGQYCHQSQPMQTMLKALGSYTIPRVGVNVSATLQNIPGPEITAQYTAANALVAPSLGRPHFRQRGERHGRAGVAVLDVRRAEQPGGPAVRQDHPDRPRAGDAELRHVQRLQRKPCPRAEQQLRRVAEADRDPGRPPLQGRRAI